VAGFGKYQKACLDQTIEAMRCVAAMDRGQRYCGVGGFVGLRRRTRVAQSRGGPFWITMLQLAGLAVLHVFVSPFLLWKKAQAAAEVGANTGPISYVDLARLAAKDYGWRFEDNWEQADFANCIAAGCGTGGSLTMLALVNHNLDQRFRDSHHPTELLKPYWAKKKLSIAPSGRTEKAGLAPTRPEQQVAMRV